jgi:hypothetical protein
MKFKSSKVPPKRSPVWIGAVNLFDNRKATFCRVVEVHARPPSKRRSAGWSLEVEIWEDSKEACGWTMTTEKDSVFILKHALKDFHSAANQVKDILSRAAEGNPD